MHMSPAGAQAQKQPGRKTLARRAPLQRGRDSDTCGPVGAREPAAQVGDGALAHWDRPPQGTPSRRGQRGCHGRRTGCSRKVRRALLEMFGRKMELERKHLRTCCLLVKSPGIAAVHDSRKSLTRLAAQFTSYMYTHKYIWVVQYVLYVPVQYVHRKV